MARWRSLGMSFPPWKSLELSNDELFLRCRAGDADAEGLRAVAEHHQRFAPLIDQLIILFGGKKHDVVFFRHALAAFNVFHRALALNHQEGLRVLMEVHWRIVTRFEVEHPRTKIIRAEEMAIFSLLRACLVDLL